MVERRPRCAPLSGDEFFQVRRRPQALHRVAEVERLTVPGRHGLLAGDQDAGVSQVLDQFAGGAQAYRGRRRTLLQGPSPAMEEPDGAVFAHPQPEAAFMEKAVVSSAQENEVRELRFAAVGPVDDVAGVAVPGGAAREAAALIAELQGPPDRRWNGAGLAAHAENPVRVVGHPDPAGVAGDAAGLFPLKQACWSRRSRHGWAPAARLPAARPRRTLSRSVLMLETQLFRTVLRTRTQWFFARRMG